MKKYIKLNINSNEYELLVADNETLAQLLRGPQVNTHRTRNRAVNWAIAAPVPY